MSSGSFSGRSGGLGSINISQPYKVDGIIAATVCRSCMDTAVVVCLLRTLVGILLTNGMVSLTLFSLERVMSVVSIVNSLSVCNPYNQGCIPLAHVHRVRRQLRATGGYSV